MADRWTYVTLDGDVLDLTGLTDEERAHLDRAADAWAAGTSYNEFANAMQYGRINPLIGQAGGMVTRAVITHPLYLVVRDMAHRLGIAQHRLGPAPGDAAAPADPFADEWLSTTEAAKRKGVAMNALHAAIERGDVLTRLKTPGGTWRLVSVNSLDRWTPSAAHQRAGKASAEAVPAGSR